MCNTSLPCADTIAAIATPPGVGGIAIVRISGPDALAIATALFSNKRFESHRLLYGRIRHQGEVLDEAMAVYMQAPRTYTREDVVEFHCHGGSVTSLRVLEAVLSQGARPALPGEFTRRAFENGRIDLSQAEAAMLLIGAQGDAAARAALRQMDGAVYRGIHGARERLVRMLSEIAACTDFPEEVEEEPTARKLSAEAEALAGDLRDACDARHGRMLSQGLSVVIAGKPNVGKSSLLNALLGEARAIVTADAGTTRDAVHGTLLLGGVQVNLTDTAGLRATEGEAERIGIARAKSAIQAADLLLVVLDASTPLSPEDIALLEDTRGQNRMVLLNKTDLPAVFPHPHDLAISAQAREGLEDLRAALAAYAAKQQSGDALLLQARHVEAAERAAGALVSMASALREGMPVDLAGIDAREALDALGEITGEGAEESIVQAVFEHFCVGK